MEIVTLEKAKEYLRVDDVDEDETIAGILSAAEKLCMDVARLSLKEWDDLCKVEESEEEIPVEVRSELFSAAEAIQMRELLKIAVLYAVGYLYEHREEADHHQLSLTLRSLLFSIREGVV